MGQERARTGGNWNRRWQCQDGIGSGDGKAGRELGHEWELGQEGASPGGFGLEWAKPDGIRSGGGKARWE